MAAQGRGRPANPALFALLLSALLGLSVPGNAQLHSIETGKHRLIFYSKSHTYLAPHLMRSFENAMQFHQRLFGYRPKEKVTTLLEDFGDFGHGGADVIPTNRISLGIAPFNYVYETMPANDRISWIMSHELVHVAAMDQPARTDRIFRRLLGGKVSPSADDPVSMAYGYLTTPRRYSPRWYHEGFAVFMETWMSGGLGRALGGYDEMVFRAMVRDRSHIYDVVGLESEGTTIDFQVGVNSYLYGARFMTFLASRHGPEKLLDWVRRGDDGKRYFSSRFRQVFGRSLGDEWTGWIRAEQEWQKANLSLIHRYPVTPLQPVSRNALGSVSRPYYDAKRGVIYAAVRYPGHIGHIAAIDADTGRMSKVHDVEGAALFYVCGLAFDPAARKLFFTTDNNYWRDLYSVDADTRKATLLIRNARTGDLAFNAGDRSLWGVRHNNGVSALVRIAPPYESFEVVHAFGYGTDIFDIDISADGRSLSAALADGEGKQRLVRFELEKLLAGDASWDLLHDFEFSSPANFVFSPDGRYLYGTSYYSGASNIFRLDLATRQMDALSNAETGLFRSLPLPDGSLLAFEYTAGGFLPVKLHPKPIEDVSAVKYLGQQVVEKYPVVKSWRLGPPDSIDLAAATTDAGVYRPLRRLKLMSAYPIVQGYKDSAAPGMRLNFSDDLNLAGVEATLSYSPVPRFSATERLHFGFKYHYWGLKIGGYYNNADFYDLFGPTKNSRKGYALNLEHTKHLLYKPLRSMDLEWGLAGYGGLERLPEYQNVAAGAGKLLAAKTALRYSRLEKSLGAVDDEKGIAWQLRADANCARSRAYPRLYANFDYGFLTPLRNSPVWFRNSAGRAFGDRHEPFANFYFGGFGNNWVDRLEISRYREYYSFPGVNLNKIDAHDFAKSTLEWNLPPLRFSRLGSTFLYCNWARLSVFSSGLAGNMTRPAGRNLHANAGAQLDFRIVLFSYLNSTFSLGYAGATDQHGNRSRELMISLKLL